MFCLQWMNTQAVKRGKFPKTWTRKGRTPKHSTMLRFLFRDIATSCAVSGKSSQCGTDFQRSIGGPDLNRHPRLHHTEHPTQEISS
jgi:hypothetical protein